MCGDQNGLVPVTGKVESNQGQGQVKSSQVQSKSIQIKSNQVKSIRSLGISIKLYSIPLFIYQLRLSDFILNQAMSCLVLSCHKNKKYEK